MSERARFAAITTFLVAAVVLGSAATAQRIERDLLTRSQVALASNGLAFYGLEFDGRDALARGFVSSRAEADRILQIIGAVPGVRTVQDDMTVELIADPQPAEPIPAAAPAPEQERSRAVRPAPSSAPSPAAEVVAGETRETPPTAAADPPLAVAPDEPEPEPATSSAPAGRSPTVRLHRIGAVIAISGSVADQDRVDRLVGSATAAFGAGNVRSTVRVAGGVAPGAWSRSIDRLVEMAQLFDGTGTIVIRGRTATVSGRVTNAGARRRMTALAADLEGLSFRLQVFAADGSTAGSGPS